MSAPTSVADTALGFTQSELLILRRQQQIISQQSGQQAIMVERGRGTSRHSQPSSRAASAASSQSMPGRIVLDPPSLQRLSASLDNLLANVRNRIQQLEDATERSIQASHDRTSNAIQNADDEITRMKRIIHEIDRLEEDCARIKRIRDVVRQLKTRVDAANTRLDRLPGSNHPGQPPRGYAPSTLPRRRP